MPIETISTPRPATPLRRPAVAPRAAAPVDTLVLARAPRATAGPEGHPKLWGLVRGVVGVAGFGVSFVGAIGCMALGEPLLTSCGLAMVGGMLLALAMAGYPLLRDPDARRGLGRAALAAGPLMALGTAALAVGHVMTSLGGAPVGVPLWLAGAALAAWGLRRGGRALSPGT